MLFSSELFMGAGEEYEKEYRLSARNRLREGRGRETENRQE